MCRWYWQRLLIPLVALAGNLVLGVISGFALFKPEDFNTTYLGQWLSFITAQPVLWFSISLILFFLTVLAGLISRLGVPLSSTDLERTYLKRLRREVELLTLRGIPAGLIASSVRLDEVFIPIELLPNRPLADHPLTERELVTYQHALHLKYVNNLIVKLFEKPQKKLYKEEARAYILL